MKSNILSALACVLSACGPSSHPTSDAGSTDAAPRADADPGDAGAPDPTERVALRLEAGAQIVMRGDPARQVLRIVVPFPDASIDVGEAAERSAWRIEHDGEPLALGPSASLFVFPDPADLASAGAAVWLVEGDVDEGASLEVHVETASGRHDAMLSARRVDTLATVRIEPFLVRALDGTGGPPQTESDLARRIAEFAGPYAQSCNIRFDAGEPHTIAIDGYDHLTMDDIVSVDDSEIVEVLRTATAETVGVLVSKRLTDLFDAADRLVPYEPDVVRAFVFREHQSTEAANALTPTLFHYDDAPAIWGEPEYYLRLPIFSHDPDLPLLDESVVPPRIVQTLQPVRDDRFFALYFGSDHLEAFGHELGHLLGLGHPAASSVVDSEGTATATNLMDTTDDCLPGCGIRISPQQCEIMLADLTAFLR